MARLLTTARLEVRPVTAGDVEAVFVVHSDPVTLKELPWGYATEAAAALADEVQAAGWPLFATIRPFNAVSQRVAEKLGFVVRETVTDEYGELLVYRRDQARTSGHVRPTRAMER